MIAPIDANLRGYGYYMIRGTADEQSHVADFAGWLDQEAAHFDREFNAKPISIGT